MNLRRGTLEFLRKVDASDPSNYPILLADFAKQCFSGLANLNTPILDKLRGGKAVAHLQRADLEDLLVAFDELTAHPSLNQLLIAMLVIANNSTLRLFKREAWYDVCKSIEAAAANPDVLCQEALGRIRDALRHSGRRPLNRVVSRTLLVKGLEYDHVIIADAAGLKSGTNLYVALTRARKTVTIFSRSHNIRF